MCIVLAVMLAALAVVIPVSAAKAVPLVVVKGLAGFPLVKDLGTADEKQLFPFAEEEQYLLAACRQLLLQQRDVIEGMLGGFVAVP